MYLINTSTFVMKEFSIGIPPYAILSHRWGSPESEVSFKDFRRGSKVGTPGWAKIHKFCEVARRNGWEWAWVDTCCIDKRSSAELSESINSMYRWYEEAAICYAFLEDVHEHSRWHMSEWWQRGWTLQELIAPKRVVFYDGRWLKIDLKSRMTKQIGKWTGIPVSVLKNGRNYTKWTIAQRMSWAAKRRTSRIEDMAYCLLGLFRINMPLLYGEGKKAFIRLQLEILRKYPDESVFAWQTREPGLQHVLATSPRCFKSCKTLVPNEQLHHGITQRIVPNLRRYNPPRVTSWGIELCANARKLKPRVATCVDGQLQEFLWAVTLTTAWNGRVRELPSTLVLARTGPAPWTYRRLHCHRYNPENVERLLAKHYRVAELEEDKKFYLQFDSDLDEDDSE